MYDNCFEQLGVGSMRLSFQDSFCFKYQKYFDVAYIEKQLKRSLGMQGGTPNGVTSGAS